jgi:hypothetical protein
MTTWRVALIALTAALAGCGGRGTPPPLLYGHVAGLHDTVGAAQRGIRLAVLEADKDPEQGAGRSVSVLHAEARGKLETLEAEAVRLAAVNRVQALLGGSTPAELERLDRARAVLVSPCGLRPPALSENVFCTGLSPAFRGQVLARCAREELKAGKVAVLVDERAEEYRQLADAFARAWAGGKGAPPLTTQRFGKGAKFDDLVGRLAGDWPEAVLFAGTPEDLRAWRRALDGQAPSLNLVPRKVPAVLFGGNDGSLPALRGERETRSGVYTATAFVKEGGTPRMGAFAAKVPGDVSGGAGRDGGAGVRQRPAAVRGAAACLRERQAAARGTGGHGGLRQPERAAQV